MCSPDGAPPVDHLGSGLLGEYWTRTPLPYPYARHRVIPTRSMRFLMETAQYHRGKPSPKQISHHCHLVTVDKLPREVHMSRSQIHACLPLSSTLVCDSRNRSDAHSDPMKDGVC